MSAINVYLQNVIQASVGNLPELISRIADERRVTNDEAIRYIQSEILRVLNGENGGGGKTEKHDELVDSLRAEIQFIKEVYNRNVADNRDDKRRISALKAEVNRLERELRTNRATVEQMDATSDEIRVYERQNEQLRAEIESRNRLIDQLRESQRQQERAIADRCRTEQQTLANIRRTLQERESSIERQNRALAELVEAAGQTIDDPDTAVQRLREIVHSYRGKIDLINQLQRQNQAQQERIDECLSSIRTSDDADEQTSRLAEMVQQCQDNANRAMAERERVWNDRQADQRAAYEARIAGLQEEKAARIGELDQQIDRYRESMEQAEAKLTQLGSNSSTLQGKIDELADMLEARRRTKSALEKAVRAYRAQGDERVLQLLLHIESGENTLDYESLVQQMQNASEQADRVRRLKRRRPPPKTTTTNAQRKRRAPPKSKPYVSDSSSSSNSDDDDDNNCPVPTKIRAEANEIVVARPPTDQLQAEIECAEAACVAAVAADDGNTDFLLPRTPEYPPPTPTHPYATPTSNTDEALVFSPASPPDVTPQPIVNPFDEYTLPQ